MAGGGGELAAHQWAAMSMDPHLALSLQHGAWPSMAGWPAPPDTKMGAGPGMESDYRPTSSTSLSPPAPGLVVPQPINARLPNNMLGGMGGRKYVCKMCPQVKLHNAQTPKYTYGMKMLRWWQVRPAAPLPLSPINPRRLPGLCQLL